MGRGNVCVNGSCEGLYYIDNDYFHVYRDSDDTSDYPETRLMADLGYDELTSSRWVYDDEGTENEWADIEECFIEDFVRLFNSFSRCDGYMRKDGRERQIILENGLFYVAQEDNEWSVAVELLQKETPYDDSLLGLQKRHYKKYLEGMKECLLNRLPSISTYKGAWTSGTIERENLTA